MPTQLKIWREKLADDKDLPKVIRLDTAAAKRWGGCTMVVPAPREVDAAIRAIRKGRTATSKAVNVLRSRKLLPIKASKNFKAYEMISGIFSVKGAAFLFQSTRQAEMKLLQLPAFRTGGLFHEPQTLTQLSPANAP